MLVDVARPDAAAAPRPSRFDYSWPGDWLNGAWHPDGAFGRTARDLHETAGQLASDSRWPAFFPSALCFVTTGDQRRSALEKVVGAAIVNRFPYVLALSVCRQALSSRHYARHSFMQLLQTDGAVAVQFLADADALEAVARAVDTIPDARTHERLSASGLRTRPAVSNAAPVFDAAYLVYEGRLVRPTHDLEGHPIYATPWIDVGSHRVYFLEITSIQLRTDIARGRRQILWRSLPDWHPISSPDDAVARAVRPLPADTVYRKGYEPAYAFPAPSTIAFEAHETRDGMDVKHLPSVASDQVQTDNDRARWPCFFPSSLGMITTWADGNLPNTMPCGSTTVVSRHPLVIAACVAAARINERYTPRATLGTIRKTGRFGCGVPYVDPKVVDAIRYTGNISLSKDAQKLAHAGLAVDRAAWSPVLRDLPVHFDCQVIGEAWLGTHVMFLGEVRRIRVRVDVTPDNPLRWYPWPRLSSAAPQQIGAGQ